MNLGRKDITINKYSSFTQDYNINPYWLLGFVEGEGTFGIKNLVTYFQIAPHTKKKAHLEGVKLYLSSIPKELNIEDHKRVHTCTLTSFYLKKKPKVLSYLISDIDVLFDYIVPFFQKLEFQTRKFIDF